VTTASHVPSLPRDFRLEQYEADGFSVLRSVFDSAYVATLRESWRSLASSIEHQGLKRQARFIFGVLPSPIGDIYKHPALVSLANLVLDDDDVALYMNRLLVKDHEWTGAVAIHQDMPYFNGGQRKVSIFVPLEPTQADGGNGGLKFVVGSHRYGNLERGTIDRSYFEAMSDEGPSLEVGDIVVMNFLTWHYSGVAVTEDERPILQIAYQPSDDGSFAGEAFGVNEPTLVTGSWRTRHFVQCRKGVIPDAG
jgi:hypothetical protein